MQCIRELGNILLSFAGRDSIDDKPNVLHVFLDCLGEHNDIVELDPYKFKTLKHMANHPL